MNSIAEYSQIGADVNPQDTGIVDLVESLEKEVSQSREKWKKELVISRVSSSLFINTDAEKFSSFLILLYKLCSKLTIESQLYLSAQLSDDDNFILSIRDHSTKITDRLNDNFTSIVLNKDFGIGKALGISKFAVMSLHKLLTVLKGESEPVTKDGYGFEIGFRFPVRLNTPDEFTSPVSESITEELPKPEPTRPRTTRIVEPPEPVPAAAPFMPPAPPVAPPQMSRPEPVRPPVPVIPDPVAPPAKKELDLGSLRCLYIEDQVDSQILFKVQMKELSEIKFAVSFEEALPMMSMYQFDFIVMDINLQGEYNGLDALKIIRTMPEFHKIPVVAVTAYVLPGDREKFIAAGFNDFISKPIFREKMIDALHKIFA